MPKSNEKDLREVPDEVRKNMSFMFVDRMDEVLQLALLQPAAEELADHAETTTVMLPPSLPADRVAPATETSIASD
jgi:predicted ATP-dependent protease